MTTFPAVRSEQPFRSGTGHAQSYRLLGEGLVRHVLADVFVARDVPDSMQLRAEAALLLVPPRRLHDHSWVVGHASAAWIHTGWRLPDPASRARLDVIISAGRNRPSDPWIRARQARLDGTEVVVLHGLPVSDPIRTAADIARELPAGPAIQVLQRLGELAQVTPAQVLHRLGDMRYARGAATARTTISIWAEQ